MSAVRMLSMILVACTWLLAGCGGGSSVGSGALPAGSVGASADAVASAQGAPSSVRTLGAGKLSAVYTTTTDWGSGFGGSVAVTNGGAAISGWRLEFDFAPQITSIWDARIVSHVGTHYVISGVAWNANLSAGASVTFGFIGSPGGVTSGPTGWVLNGVAIGGTSPSPFPNASPSPTATPMPTASPSPSPVPSPSPSSGVSFTYATTSDWGGGFGGSVTIANGGAATISDWTLAFDFDRQIDSIWNVRIVSHLGTRYVVEPEAWARDIVPGKSVSFGFNGTPGRVTAGPTAWALQSTSSGGSSGGTGGGTSGGTPPTPSGTVSVPGWPSYLAMGAVTGLGDNETAAFATRPVDAIFKYSGSGGNGDPGQILYPLWTIKTVRNARAITQSTGRRVIPVMVDYTAQMSGGTADTDFLAPDVAMHFINLANDAHVLQTFASADNPHGGSIILNPDLLGMVQQNGLYTGGPAAAVDLRTMSIPVNASLAQAVTFMTRTFTCTDDKGNIFTGTQQQIADQMAARYGDAGGWSTYAAWNAAAPVWFAQCVSDPRPGITIPSFTDDFKGWIQANNWLIRTFGPAVTFGWQENLWAVGSASWVHQGSGDAYVYGAASKATADLLTTLGVYSGPWRPDFLAFDRYEMDDTAAVAWGAIYSATDWDNVLTFGGQVSAALGNIPVMMWQIPGGHLQVVGDVDARSSNASTAPVYFFGDAALTRDLSNLKPYLQAITLSLPYVFTSTTTSRTVMTYLTQGGFDWTVDNGRLARAARNNVFAILWGGGSTTSVGVFPSDDGGWLAAKRVGEGRGRSARPGEGGSPPGLLDLGRAVFSGGVRTTIV